MTAPRSTLLLVLAWLFAGAFAFAAPQDGPAPEHETLARARLLYQPQSWPAGPRRAGLALAELEHRRGEPEAGVPLEEVIRVAEEAARG